MLACTVVFATACSIPLHQFSSEIRWWGWIRSGSQPWILCLISQRVEIIGREQATNEPSWTVLLWAGEEAGTERTLCSLPLLQEWPDSECKTQHHGEFTTSVSHSGFSALPGKLWPDFYVVYRRFGILPLKANIKRAKISYMKISRSAVIEVTVCFLAMHDGVWDLGAHPVPRPLCIPHRALPGMPETYQPCKLSMLNVSLMWGGAVKLWCGHNIYPTCHIFGENTGVY